MMEGTIDEKIKQAAQIKSEADFDAFIKTDEKFQEKLKRAATEFSLSMPLAQHISSVDSDRRVHFEMYLDARTDLLALKKASDRYYDHLRQLTPAHFEDVYGEGKRQEEALYALAVEAIKHLACTEAITSELSARAISFSYKTMGKSFQTNLREMIQEKSDALLPKMVEFIMIMENAGLKPMERLEGRKREFEKAVGVSEQKPPPASPPVIAPPEPVQPHQEPQPVVAAAPPSSPVAVVQGIEPARKRGRPKKVVEEQEPEDDAPTGMEVIDV